MLGKIDTLLNEKLQKVEWGKFRLGDLFDIQNTLSFNKDILTTGDEYDYVTRTSQNQGILQSTGFVNQENINESGIWSLGLLQMDFFYRKRPWYAGQFVRKIIPKIQLSEKSILYFTTLLNSQKGILLSVLVRDVDSVFKEANAVLPIKKNGEINFEFIENFISELEAERLSKLNTYLSVTGLKDYKLTSEEQKALEDYKDLNFDKINITKIFNINNTKNILSSSITVNSGDTPYLCASKENNSVNSYISYDKKYMDKGNCIFIAGKTFVVTYQDKDFYSNDSHNLCLSLKAEDKKDKFVQLFLTTCIDKSLSYKYSWGGSISAHKIQDNIISIPLSNNEPIYKYMHTLISAIEKQIIKDVVLQ